MLPPVLTIATIVALIDLIHLSKELWERFHTCSSLLGILERFLELLQSGTGRDVALCCRPGGNYHRRSGRCGLCRLPGIAHCTFLAQGAHPSGINSAGALNPAIAMPQRTLGDRPCYRCSLRARSFASSRQAVPARGC